MNKIFKIVEIIDSTKIVINAGSNEGIRENQRFLVYSLDGKEIIDPDTGKSLGNLEVVKGTGIASFIQEKMCTIISDMYTKYNPLLAPVTTKKISLYPSSNFNDKVHISFKDIKIGDFVKPI